MKIGLVGITNKPSTAKFSHNAGWTFVLKSISNSEIVTNPLDIHKYDKLVLSGGINYKENSWNFIGGVTDYTKQLLAELMDYQGELVSYNERIDLTYLSENRKELQSHNYAEVKLLRTDNVNRKLIVGDSHSVSIYKPGWSINRFDGKTLNGFLNNPYAYITGDPTDLTLYFGNIDSRFHIHRFGGIPAVNDLIKRYTAFAGKLVDQGKNVTLQCLIPAEDESRKLPGTGLYKGEAYFGTREERNGYINLFNHLLLENAPYFGCEVGEWDLPTEGFNAEGKFYCMESRQSVHLRPEWYKHKDELI